MVILMAPALKGTTVLSQLALARKKRKNKIMSITAMFVLFFFISATLEEGISGFGDRALKRLVFKVCCIFLLSKLLLTCINPANVRHNTHTLKDKLGSEEC